MDVSHHLTHTITTKQKMFTNLNTWATPAQIKIWRELHQSITSCVKFRKRSTVVLYCRQEYFHTEKSRNPFAGFQVCNSSGRFSLQTDEIYEKLHLLCIYLTSKFHQVRTTPISHLGSNSAQGGVFEHT